MNDFKVGDWVIRKEEFIDGVWLRKTENRSRYPYRIVRIRELSGFLYLDGLPLSWGPDFFDKVPPPKTKFNELDYL